MMVLGVSFEVIEFLILYLIDNLVLLVGDVELCVSVDCEKNKRLYSRRDKLFVWIIFFFVV